MSLVFMWEQSVLDCEEPSILKLIQSTLVKQQLDAPRYKTRCGMDVKLLTNILAMCSDGLSTNVKI